MTFDPLTVAAVVALVAALAGLLLWLAEWRPGEREVPPPERTVTPQDWRRRQ